MKQIILDLYSNLSGIGINWIDLDKNQLSGMQRPAVDFPCCLIGLSINANDINDTEQVCSLRIELKVAFDNLTNQTDIYAPEQALEKSLEQLDIIEQIHTKMQGYDGTAFEGCSRKSINPQTFVSGIAGYVMVYEAFFTEETE